MEMNPEFAAAFEQLQKTPFVVSLTGAEMCIIISQIQTALRHPKNTGPGANIAKQIAEQWIVDVSNVAPDIKEIMLRGWDKQFDEI